MRRRVGGRVFVLAGVIVSFTLGCIGFFQYNRMHDAGFTPLDIAYLSWQLFAIESGKQPLDIPIALEIARVIAPLTLASALFGVFYGYLRDWWRADRLSGIQNHVVICGMGRRGKQLAEECAAMGKRVVAIDTDITVKGLPIVGDGRAFFVQGDATDPATLQRARVHRADSLLALCGDDGTNIAIALRARDTAARANAAGPGTSKRLSCVVQVIDFTFAALFKEHNVVQETSDVLDVSLFNSYEIAARMLWRDHPLDYEPIAEDDPRSMRLVVFGFGQMGESVVVQAAKVCHLANRKRLRVTIIDRAAEARKRSFLVRYPQIDKVCDVEFIEMECDDRATVNRLDEIAEIQDELTTIVVCLDNDSRNVQYALSLRRNLTSDAVPILVRVTSDSGLSNLFSATENKRNLYCFGSTRSTCSWEMVKGEGLDALARVVHEDYVANQRERGFPESASTVAWDQLSPGLRDSNRQQADHLPVKLRALGYHVRQAHEAGGDVRVPEERVETLARTEHHRWNAERFLAGWTLGVKDVARRRSPYLVPYDELAEAIKENDRDAVRAIPRLVDLAKRTHARNAAT